MNRTTLTRACALVGGLLLWQVVAWSGGFPEHVLPSPTRVVTSLWEGIRDGTLLRAVWVSLRRLALGFAVASAGAAVLGAALARSRTLDTALGTWIAGLQTLPSICWMPLALLWFGLNESAILFVVVQATLGAVSLAVRDTLRDVPPLWLRAARCMGERGASLWWRVLLPAALPGTLSALRTGWAFAWRALMAGELLFIAGGLGQAMHVGRELNDMPRVMAAMVVIVVLGLLFDTVVLGTAERRVRARRGLA